MKWKLSLAIGFGVLICTAAVYFIIIHQQREPSIVKQTDAEKLQNIEMAYVLPPRLDPYADQVAIADEYFSELNTALRSKDEEQIAKLISPATMLLFCEKSGVIQYTSKKEQDRMREILEKALPMAFAQMTGLMAFDAIEIRGIEPITPNEFAVYTLEWNSENQIYTRNRWWLIKSSNQWTAYDFEDLDSNIRLSKVLGLSLSYSKKPAGWHRPMIALSRELNSANLNPDTLLQLAKKTLAAKPPVGIADMVRFIHVSLSEDYEERLLDLEYLEKQMGRIPGIIYFKAESLYYIGNYKEAIALFHEYAEILGMDSDICMNLSDAYFYNDEEGGSEKALEYAKKGVEMNPHNISCLISYCALLEEQDWSEMATKIHQTHDPELAYESMLNYLIEIEYLDQAKFLLDQFGKNFPELKSTITDFEKLLEEQTKKPNTTEDEN